MSDASVGTPQVTPVLVRPGLAVGTVTTTVLETRSPERREHTVLVNVGRPYRLVESVGDLTRETRGAPGDVAVVPAGHPLLTRSRDGLPQAVECVAVLIAPELMDEVLDAGGVASGHDLVATLGSRSPHVAQLATMAHQGLADSTGLGRLALESLAHALTVSVARDHSGVRSLPTPEDRGGLSRGQLGRVLHHIEDNLADPLTLAELAALAHVSPFHFTRLFRASMGTSPHQYVVGRRVARARDLLVHTSLPLAEVATRSGFADQSHLTRHLRRHLGHTPAAVRATRGAP